MNTRHARMILAILREGGFTAAAKALHITQPTLSKTVSQIEEKLGEPIFVRGHASVALTPAGELYVQAARRMIQAEDQLSEGISQLRGRVSGTLRVGLKLHRSGDLLPQVLSEFIAAYPGVCLEVCESDAPGLESLLLQGEIDMAFFSGETHNPKLDYRQIASEEIVLMAGRNTDIARRIPSGTTIGLHEAGRERFVLPMYKNPSRRFVDDLFSSCGIKPQISMICDNVKTAMRCCDRANLVMLAPLISLLCDSSAMKSLSHYHLGTDAYLPPFYLVSNHDTPLAPHGAALYNLIIRRYHAMSAYRP